MSMATEFDNQAEDKMNEKKQKIQINPADF